MGTNWFMPAFVKSRFGESGIRLLEGTMVCCFDLKKSRKCCLIWADVMVRIAGVLTQSQKPVPLNGIVAAYSLRPFISGLSRLRRPDYNRDNPIPPSNMDTPPSQTPPSAAPLADQVKDEAKGFFASLTDFSFESFITPRIIKVVYFLALVGVAMYTLGWLGYCFYSHNMVTGFFMAVITTPIVAALGVVLARVYVELIMLAFKVLETLKRIEAKQR